MRTSLTRAVEEMNLRISANCPKLLANEEKRTIKIDNFEIYIKPYSTKKEIKAKINKFIFERDELKTFFLQKKLL